MVDSLRALLASCSWAMLRAITLTHRQHFNTRWTKQLALHQLLTFFTSGQRLQLILRRLTPEQLDALRALDLHGGAMPRYRFTAAFGELKPLRPWRDDAPVRPWQHPDSIAEQLYYQGLLFLTTVDNQEAVVVPDEIRRLLPQPTDYVPPPPTPLPTTPDIVLDIAHLLAYVQHRRIHLLHERWLSPRHFRCLNMMLTTYDTAADTARSELQTTNLRFVHYLAEVASLVTVAQHHLVIAPEARDWLQANELVRHRVLHTAWLADLQLVTWDMPLWERYRFHGKPDVVAKLLGILGRFPGTTLRLSDLDHEVRLVCIGEDIPYLPETDLTELRRILTGPLTWIGWLTCDAADTVRLTPLGACILAHNTTPIPPPPVVGAELTLTADGLDISLPQPPRRPPLVPLVSLGLRLPPTSATTLPSLHRTLTHEQLAGLLSHGFSGAWIREQLRQLCQAPLTKAIVTQLDRWERETRGVALQTRQILHIAEPQVRERILTDRSARKAFAETLSPHHIAIAPPEIQRLLRRLRRMGFAPLVGLNLETSTDVTPTPPPAADSLTIDQGSAAQLWLALRLVISLGDLVVLPYMPAGGLLSTLGDLLGDDVVALEAMAEEMDTRLRGVIDGYGPFPSPLPDTDPDTVVDLLDAALREQQPVEIVYHTTGRGERTTRVVEPLRVEERGGARYLYAYCRLRQEERVFRFDRIERAELLSD